MIISNNIVRCRPSLSNEMTNKDNYLIEHFFLEINGINLIKYTPQVQKLGNGELE